MTDKVLRDAVEDMHSRLDRKEAVEVPHSRVGQSTDMADGKPPLLCS